MSICKEQRLSAVNKLLVSVVLCQPKLSFSAKDQHRDIAFHDRHCYIYHKTLQQATFVFQTSTFDLNLYYRGVSSNAVVPDLIIRRKMSPSPRPNPRGTRIRRHPCRHTFDPRVPNSWLPFLHRLGCFGIASHFAGRASPCMHVDAGRHANVKSPMEARPVPRLQRWARAHVAKRPSQLNLSGPSRCRGETRDKN